ncbi:MAG: 50S ribosomal protein L29 [Candidatus Yonathbacteria bacterium RIFOXYC2_FULL_47_9]|nr:MAG: 50S ribosomal protein L29 [Candidatus Yonathbacteria bacterium RIFOXYC2_FULL_47_9]HAT68166.1 50S ribosomal protein L29 [Candidatus Yonathbacteria bacterium]
MTDISKKSNEDLVKTIDSKREELRALRFDIAGSAKKNTKATMLARKEIARSLTEVNARKKVAA